MGNADENPLQAIYSFRSLVSVPKKRKEDFERFGEFFLVQFPGNTWIEEEETRLSGINVQVRCTKRIYRGQWGRGWKFIELTPCFSSASPRRCFIGLFLLAPTKSVEFIPRNFYRANDPPFLSLPSFSPSPPLPPFVRKRF